MARGLMQTLVLGILKHINMMYFNMNKIHYIYGQGVNTDTCTRHTETS